MEKELTDKLEKIEKQLAQKKKDFWEKLQIVIPLFIPLAIALAGWYFTNQHNSSQLEIQKINNDNQLQVALINSSVGQSELIKDFMQHLTGKDSAARNIAIEAILYAAPTPGKRIVEIIAKSGDSKSREVANDALAGKRQDLIDNLFSKQKQVRLIAASEITSNWTTDEVLLSKLIKTAVNCLLNKDSSPDCENGVFNSTIVLQSFSNQLLAKHKGEITDMVNRIPKTSAQTLSQGMELLKSME